MIFEVSRKQIKNLSPSNRDKIIFNSDVFPTGQDFKNKSIFLAPNTKKSRNILEAERKVSMTDLKNQQLKTMPGMKIKWYIDRDDVLPFRYYQEGYKSKMFVRLVNIIHENKIGLNEFWQIIKGIKKIFIESYDSERNSCERARLSH